MIQNVHNKIYKYMRKMISKQIKRLNKKKILNIFKKLFMISNKQSQVKNKKYIYRRKMTMKLIKKIF